MSPFRKNISVNSSFDVRASLSKMCLPHVFLIRGSCIRTGPVESGSMRGPLLYSFLISRLFLVRVLFPCAHRRDPSHPPSPTPFLRGRGVWHRLYDTFVNGHGDGRPLQRGGGTGSATPPIYRRLGPCRSSLGQPIDTEAPTAHHHAGAQACGCKGGYCQRGGHPTGATAFVGALERGLETRPGAMVASAGRWHPGYRYLVLGIIEHTSLFRSSEKQARLPRRFRWHDSRNC